MADHRITALLEQLRDGDQSVWPELVAEIDALIRPIAVSKLVRDRTGATWDPSDLVQAAMVQLLKSGQFHKAQSRAPLIKGAALVIRNLLIDRARRRQTAESGGYRERIALDDVIDRISGKHHINLLTLDDALSELREINPVHYEIVMLRFFAGQTFPSIAQMLSLSLSTVENYWYKEIKPWLFVMLS